MKKVALFSLFACLSFVSVGFAANNTNLDKVCRQYLKDSKYENAKCDKPDSDSAITPDMEGLNNYINKPCKTAPKGVQGDNHRCFLNMIKKNPAEYTISCAAKVCDKDHLLWFSEDKKGKLLSQGACFERSWLQSYCAKGCGCDKQTEDCVLDEKTLTAPNWSIPTAAFIGEKACHCVPKDEETCSFKFDADIECADGSKKTYKNELKIPKKLFKDGKCTDARYPTFEAWVEGQIDAVKQYALDQCKDAKTVTSIIRGDGKLTDAKKSLDSFFASIGTGSGLRTADGKFNTVRLASDISAGVVLGTVGGVVSGVVIKKKQIEKGFDALHCTVGGQKIADWGDEFEVGLQK